MSTWTTSFPSSREAPRRGANCSVTYSIKLAGYSAPISRRKQKINNPYTSRNWGKEMGPGPPRRQSWGGTLTQYTAFYALVLWLATTVTFKTIATCPGFIGNYRGHAEVNVTGSLKGDTRDGNVDGNGESGLAGTERGRERRVGEAGASRGGSEGQR